jgi:uncharacterized protein (TIGR00730 family)
MIDSLVEIKRTFHYISIFLYKDLFQNSQSKLSMMPLPPVSTPNPIWMSKIQELITLSGTNPQTPSADFIGQIIYASLRLTEDSYDMGQLKLITRAFKEMIYAYRIFNQHPSGRRVSIFGSARTPPSHPDYIAAKNFSTAMSANQWVCMTGAADGIMRAGLEGAEKETSFGLSIRLPFENTTQSLLAGDPKLINFRYFFTRKLMFLSHSDAVAAFPGGVGTQDELFEVLTLMQTGKTNIIPVLLIEGEKGTYWEAWQNYLKENLLKNQWISLEDFNFFYHASTIEQAVQHILHFYSRYHSSRYVKDSLVIRMLSPLTDEQIDQLNQKFQPLIKEGKIVACHALEEENDHLDLPRLVFQHNHQHFGLLRALIDQINDF